MPASLCAWPHEGGAGAQVRRLRHAIPDRSPRLETASRPRAPLLPPPAFPEGAIATVAPASRHPTFQAHFRHHSRYHPPPPPSTLTPRSRTVWPVCEHPPPAPWISGWRRGQHSPLVPHPLLPLHCVVLGRERYRRGARCLAPLPFGLIVSSRGPGARWCTMVPGGIAQSLCRFPLPRIARLRVRVIAIAAVAVTVAVASGVPSPADGVTPPARPTFIDVTADANLSSFPSLKYGGPVVADLDADGTYDLVLSNHMYSRALVYWGVPEIGRAHV